MEKESRRRHWILCSLSSFKEGLFSRFVRSKRPPTVTLGHEPDRSVVLNRHRTLPPAVISPPSTHISTLDHHHQIPLKRAVEEEEEYGPPASTSTPAAHQLLPPPAKQRRISPPQSWRLYNPFAVAALPWSTPSQPPVKFPEQESRSCQQRKFHPYTRPSDLLASTSSSRPTMHNGTFDLSRATPPTRDTPLGKSQLSRQQNYDIIGLKRYEDRVRRAKEEEEMEGDLARLRNIVKNFPATGPANVRASVTPSTLSSCSSRLSPLGSPTPADYDKVPLASGFNEAVYATPSTSLLLKGASASTPLLDLTNAEAMRRGGLVTRERSSSQSTSGSEELHLGRVVGDDDKIRTSPVEKAIAPLSKARQWPNTVGVLESRWRSEKYRDEQKRNDQLIRQCEEEVRLRGEARLNRQIYNQEQLRLQLQLEGLLLDRPVSRKREDFPPLSGKALDIVTKAWDENAPMDEVLAQGFNVDIKRRDLMTLSETVWLNDEVINFFMNLLVERSKQQSTLPSLHAFSTFFYTTLVKKGYTSVKRWTKKVDIFAHEMLIIPVHLSMHWCLCTVDFKEKCINYYDSLGGDNQKALSCIKDYIQQESLDKKQRPFPMDGWTVNCRRDIPRQMNGSDCGMFACRFAEYASRKAAINFTQAQMPYFRQRTVYEICSVKLM